MAASFVHPSALVESPIGEGTRVWAFTHVMNGVDIGRDCNIGSHCFLESGARVGDRATIKNGNMIWAGVTIGDGVFVGPSVLFTNDRYPRSARLPEAGTRHEDSDCWLEETRVERGASLGAGSILVPGVHISAFASVGAGAVVTKDVPAHALVTGSPAGISGWVCMCGLPLPFKGTVAHCESCGFKYLLEEGSLSLVREASQ